MDSGKPAIDISSGPPRNFLTNKNGHLSKFEFRQYRHACMHLLTSPSSRFPRFHRYDLAPQRVMWSLTEYPHVIDGVHCAPIGPDGLVLEQPRYLSPPPNPIPASAPESTPPSGLTTEELTGWCGWSTSAKSCSLRESDGVLPSRARLCTWNATSNRCEFRTILQKDYDVYAPGKAMFKTTTHPVVYPTCFLWVSRGAAYCNGLGGGMC